MTTTADHRAHPISARLFRNADPHDIDTARTAVALITTRGFHRERDLVALLDDALRRHRP